MLYFILEGLVAGAAYGLWKYYNKLQEEKLKGTDWKLSFNKRKFAKTLLIGAIVGGVAAYTGITVEVAFGNELLYFGAVVAVEEAIKTVRNLLKNRGYIE